MLVCVPIDHQEGTNHSFSGTSDSIVHMRRFLHQLHKLEHQLGQLGERLLRPTGATQRQ
jgi:hypothetical protein